MTHCIGVLSPMAGMVISLMSITLRAEGVQFESIPMGTVSARRMSSMAEGFGTEKVVISGMGTTGRRIVFSSVLMAMLRHSLFHDLTDC